MNKTAKKVVATILTTVMTVGAATVVSADDLSITLSHQPYSHALPSYIGEEEGIFERRTDLTQKSCGSHQETPRTRHLELTSGMQELVEHRRQSQQESLTTLRS